jgi:hypothetical protein
MSFNSVLIALAAMFEYGGIRQWRSQEFFSWGGGGSTNSGEDRGQKEWGSGGDSPLGGDYTQFANE